MIRRYLLAIILLAIFSPHSKSQTVFEQTCPAGFVSYAPLQTFDNATSKYRQNYCADANGNVQEITSSSGVTTATFYPGIDIGAQINAAYTACPFNGCTILVPASPTGCWNFSTTINFTTLGKYPLLRGIGPSNGTPAGVCMNFIPSSGIAIEMDYVPANANLFVNGHGISDLLLINNMCITTSSCGGTSFAIDNGSAGWGASNARMENVAVIGFQFAYNNSNSNNVPGITWANPYFAANNLAIINGNNTNNNFVKGFFIGNGTVLQATVANGAEYNFDGTTFSTNGLGFDLTRSLNKNTATWTAPHFEDSPALSATSPHYIFGLCSCRIYGGTMETDQASGTQDWFASMSAGSLFEVHGLDLFSGGKTFTQAFLLNTTARANVQVSVNQTASFPLILGGTGAAPSIFGQISAGNPSTIGGAQLVMTNPITVASLPAAASNPGMMIRVSDSTAIAAEGQVCAGGGAVTAFAFSTGGAWKCF